MIFGIGKYFERDNRVTARNRMGSKMAVRVL